MRIESLTPTGEVIETIDLNDCFNHRHAYKRYRIFTDNGTYMLTPETCYPDGWRIPDDEILPDNDNFKFR